MTTRRAGSLDAALTQWERHLTIHLGRSATTVRHYRRAVVRCATFCQQHYHTPLLTRDPTALTAALTQWFDHWIIQYELGDTQADGMRLQVYGVRAFLQWAHGAGLCATPPLAVLRPPRPRQRLPRPVPMGSVQQVLAVAANLRDQLLVLCLYHGLRNAEACALTTDRLRVDHTLEQIELRVLGKGGKERIVFLNAQASPVCARYLVQRFAADRHAEWWAQTSPTLGDTRRWLQLGEWVLERRVPTPQPLMITDQGGALHQRWVDRRFEWLNQQAGLHGVTPHRLRHTCGTELLEADADLRHVQEVLGHARITTTTLYTAVTRNRRATTMDRLPTLTLPESP